MRARTKAAHRIGKRVLRALHEEYAEDIIEADRLRPRCREQCATSPRPCPFVSCKWNLYLDVTPAGGIKLNFPDLEPDELGASCALDIADAGGITLERVGEVMNLTRERIRQLEVEILEKMARLQLFKGIAA